MELGATICLPRNPGCGLCPVEKFCAARSAGTERELPVKLKKPNARDITARSCAVERRLTEGVAAFSWYSVPLRSGAWPDFWELPSETSSSANEGQNALRIFASDRQRPLSPLYGQLPGFAIQRALCAGIPLPGLPPGNLVRLLGIAGSRSRPLRKKRSQLLRSHILRRISLEPSRLWKDLAGTADKSWSTGLCAGARFICLNLFLARRLLIAVVAPVENRSFRNRSATAPFFTAAGVVQAATETAGTLAPNAIATIYGTNLSWTTHIVDVADLNDGTLPTSVDGVSVYVQGILSSLLYVSPGQINFIIPYELTLPTVRLSSPARGLRGRSPPTERPRCRSILRPRARVSSNGTGILPSRSTPTGA